MEQELKIGTKIDHERYGIGVITNSTLTSYEVLFEIGGKVQLSKSRFEAEIISEGEGEEKTHEVKNAKDVIELLESVLDRFGVLEEEVELGSKWEGGTMILKPGNSELQEKEIPIETFFHKIVMIRDRLRVLEQNINSHKVLTDEDKVNMQQYITRAYGSLTTFNVLFAEKDHYFSGSSGK